MRRREFIALLGGAAAAWPLAARGQQSNRMPCVGILIAVADDAEGQARLGAFKNGMRDLGWTDGGKVRIEVRFAAGSVAKANDYAAELVSLAPDVLVANSSPAVAALQQRTRTIPIVFAQVVDPVSAGFVENLARPGGNITGFVSLDYAFGAKWLELLKEIAPRVSRVGVLRDPTTSGAFLDRCNPESGRGFERHRAQGRRVPPHSHWLWRRCRLRNGPPSARYRRRSSPGLAF